MERLPLRLALGASALAVLALAAVGLAACECGDPAPASAPTPEPEPTPAPEDPSATIPRATRTDLPEAVPALTLTVAEDAVELDASELIATWRPGDRERVPDARLHVRAEVAGPTPGYRIPAIAAGFERMTELERARAGAAISPSVFAVRVDPDVPWRRVIDAVYSGANSGWSEPRFVLRAEDGREVFLSMPIPPVRAATAAERRAVAEVERAARQVEQLRGALEGAQPPAPEGDDLDAPPPPLEPDSIAPIHVVVTDARTVRVSIGARPLAPGCASVHDAAVDVVPSLDPEPLARCLDAARGAGPTISGARFSSDGTIPFRDLAPLLELLRAHHDTVELTAPL